MKSPEKVKTAFIDTSYSPMADPVYMSEQMLGYFQDKLINWKKTLIHLTKDTPETLVDMSIRESDPVDNGINKEINYPQVACIEHQKMLLDQIDMAIERINNGTYGFCEQTGEPIGVARLESYPIARLCVEAQEQYEKSSLSKQFSRHI
ncbi:TraR/DksA family transcriptional regulator [Candidatus Paracaedibacter symbiosus]|uniref:TraR/DksA family transcriptional regulator n=1 Tax=Candidatus Paracaedibacter symbiosus TaxID=244582 RepID=UPI0005093B6B|nr:TraR/DksA family transcriptional regulator [Candidatus Paracaedibacter symbiosus]